MLSLLELDTLTAPGVYKQIEKEAQSIGIETMWALCQEAGVNYTTVNKWKLGQSDPQFRVVRMLLVPIQSRMKSTLTLAQYQQQHIAQLRERYDMVEK